MLCAQLVLFDIDGTLLLTGGVSTRCFRAAIGELGGTLADPLVLPAGQLDSQIVAFLLRSAGLPDDRQHIDRVRDSYLRRLAESLSPGRHAARLLPGIGELLAALELAGIEVGILTGNFRRAVEIKLAAVGLELGQFAIIAADEDGAQRSALVPVAAGRYAQRHGQAPAPGRIVVVGDTPGDVHCARDNGGRALATATGRFNVRELTDAGADLAVKDLSDTQAVMRWIIQAV